MILNISQACVLGKTSQNMMVMVSIGAGADREKGSTGALIF
jgi:hypothetical protein